MKTTLLATITLAVFSLFAFLTFAGGHERIASMSGHDASVGAAVLTPVDPGHMPSSGGQTVWLDGSISGRPWWQQPRQVH